MSVHMDCGPDCEDQACPVCGCCTLRPHNEHIGLDGPDEAGPCSCDEACHKASGEADG